MNWFKLRKFQNQNLPPKLKNAMETSYYITSGKPICSGTLAEITNEQNRTENTHYSVSRSKLALIMKCHVPSIELSRIVRKDMKA